ncbi:MAG: diguanylate cyclase [Fimbriimonadaceae bacterium]
MHRTKSRTNPVLVVEDDANSAYILEHRLKTLGYEVVVAHDGFQGWEKFQQIRPRIVVSDWMMPGMDGIDLCRKIRSEPGPYVFVILTTSKGQRDDRIAAFREGVDDYLTKPLDPHDLAARLDAAERVLNAENAIQQQAHELEVARTRFEMLFQSIPVAAVSFSADEVAENWNKFFERLFGFEPSQIKGRHVSELLTEIDRGLGSLSQSLGRLLELGSVVREATFVGEDGRTHYLEVYAIPLPDTVGQPGGGLISFIDITERKMAEARQESEIQEMLGVAVSLAEERKTLEVQNVALQAMAQTDPLTGIYNRRAFELALADAMMDASKSDRPLSMLMVDVDDFKRYNDDFGHLAGDQVLRDLARILAEGCRDNDLAARYGGEEFAVVLSSADSETAQSIADRMRQSIAEAAWPRRPVYASFGVATYRPGEDDMLSFIDRADRSLYEAKQRGKNQVVRLER